MPTLRKHGRNNRRWFVYMWNEGAEPTSQNCVEVLAPTSDAAEDLAMAEHGHFDTYAAEEKESCK